MPCRDAASLATSNQPTKIFGEEIVVSMDGSRAIDGACRGRGQEINTAAYTHTHPHSVCTFRKINVPG